MWFSSKNSISRKQTLIEEQLRLGEYNWKLKPVISSISGFPNLKIFLTELEENNDIQVGLFSDLISANGDKSCSFRIPIYDEKSLPRFNFLFLIAQMSSNSQIAFTGYLGNFAVPKELNNPNPNYYALIITNKFDDLTVEEYKTHFEQTLHEALTKQGYNPDQYFLKTNNGSLCWNKIFEQNLRKKMEE